MSLPDVIATLSHFTPSDLPGERKIRIGNPGGDGGYVMLDRFRPGQICYSFGIAQEITFDLDLAERGLEVFMFDPTIEGPPQAHPRCHFRREGIGPAKDEEKALFSLADHMTRLGHDRRDMILKMDVEGWEWESLAAAGPAVLAHFEQITLEVHGLRQLHKPVYRARVNAAMDALTAGHTLFHVHANNAVDLAWVEGLPVAGLLELSLLRKDLAAPVPSRTLYPTALDVPNIRWRPDNMLWFFPFLPAQMDEDIAARMREDAARIGAQREAAALREKRRATRAARAAAEA